MRVALLLLGGLLFAGSSPAQQPTKKPAEKGTIEGQVLKATSGEPIKKARITLAPMGRGGPVQAIATLTDANGKFMFKEVDAGQYRLWAQRNGYVRQEYGQAMAGAMRSGPNLTISAGGTVRDVTFRLMPAAVITGSIYDEDGDPAANVRVQLLRYRYMRGQRELVPSDGAQTNDIGEFRIAGLSPGRVYLSAIYVADGAPTIVIPSEVASASGTSPPDEGYAPVFYPNATDISQARPIELTPGDEVRGIDMTLRPVRAVRVRGRVVGEGRGSIYVSLVQRGPGFRSIYPGQQAMADAAQGTFELRGVIPGSYILTATASENPRGMVSGMSSPSPQSYTAREFLEVGSSDIDGVTLMLGANVDVSGRVRMEGTPEHKFTRSGVTLMPRDDVVGGGGGSGIGPDGAFAMRNLPPMAYRVLVSGMLEDTYLKSVRYNSEEVLESGFVLNRGASGILDVLLSPKGGRIEGNVRGDGDAPPVGATVVLVPSAERRALTYLYRSVAVDQVGHYSLRGIAPGSYRLYAFQDIEPGAWLDPEFLASVERQGESIKVEESAQINQVLKLILSSTLSPSIR